MHGPVSPFRAENVFHDRRLEIIDCLPDNEARSVRAFAEALGYDTGVASRDLQALASLDLDDGDTADDA